MSLYPEFIASSYKSQSPISDQEELINLYVEQMEAAGATGRAALYPTPGFKEFFSVNTVGGRANFAQGGRAFVVMGAQFYEFFRDGSTIARGSAMAIDSNPATICSNGDGGGQLLVTSGGSAYVYDLTANTLTLIPDLPATQGGSLYGYFLAFDINTSTVRMSDLLDGTTWDPTQFFQRTLGTDPWTAMLVTPYGQILLVGSQTGGFWYNNGAFPIPFAPDPSGLIEEGIASTFSVKQAGKSTCWLSTNKNGGYAVQSATGYTPKRISDHAFEYQVSRYDHVDDCLGETYEDQGHQFYLLTFPSAKVTWCYDFNTGKWHKRGTWISERQMFDSWRPTWHCFAFGKHLMADRQSDTVYEMDIAFTGDVEGRMIRRLRRAPALVNQNRRIFFDEFELLMEVGLGSPGITAGYDPQIMMRYSNDGGLTWGNYHQASVGLIGQFGIRVRWKALGQGRKRVFEVSMTDPIPWRISEAFIHTHAGDEVAA